MPLGLFLWWEFVYNRYHMGIERNTNREGRTINMNDNLHEQDFDIQNPDQTDKEPDEELLESGKKNKGYDFYTLLHDLVYILAWVTIVFVFAIRLVGVDGASMYPTLHHSDYLALLSNVFYQNPEQGDVIVMTVPYYENEPIVKRVIAVEGQTIDIDFNKGLVYVDGQLIQEPYINEPTYESNGAQAMQYPAVVPEDHIFVMGDNRNRSSDSRFAPVGMVSEDDILGKVLGILLPGKDEDTEKRDFSRIGALDNGE